ncbi:hypothetical protein FRC07_013304 [Ceratobasidium sp. 392]|nr:hypothetical protein FRC07_013304 [Ceratobasidium sp. 392]
MHDPNFPPNLAIQPSSHAPNHRLVFDQESGIKQYGIAGRIWEAAYILAAYTTPSAFAADASRLPVLEFDPQCSLFREGQMKPITVVEIGSGTGYAGIHVAHQLDRFRQKTHAHAIRDKVILTDLENVVPLLEQGVGEHRETIDIGVQLEARALEWGSTMHMVALAEELNKVRSLTKETPFWQVFGTWFAFIPVLAKQTGEGEVESRWSRFGRAMDTHILVAKRRPESFQWVVPDENSQLMNGFGPSPSRLDDTFESLLLLEINEEE